MKSKYFLLVCIIFISIPATSQVKIGNNPTSINSASLLEMETTNKGMVFPRVSLTNISSSSPLPSGLLTGTVVYNTNASVINGSGTGLYIWNGSNWAAVSQNVSTTAWSLTGNSGTTSSTNFLGTTDNTGLHLRTNNIERLLIDSFGDVGIGSSAFNATNRERILVDYGNTTSHTLANLKGSIDGYFQVNLQNQSNGVNASTDYVATADDGTDSTYYIDMGINSSTYTRSVGNWGGAHDGYLYTNSRNLLIGTQAATSDIIFLAGGSAIASNTALRVKYDGNVVIGKGDNTANPVGNILRGPNANGTDIPGGDLALNGGDATGSGTGGSVNMNGGSTSSGTTGSVNINADNNSATNINTGTSTGTVTIGDALNNINLPKLAASSVVLTDAGNNLATTTPSSNTYLFYDGANFNWASAATLSSFSANAPLTYNNTTGVFAINKATTSANGYLSSTDWKTFNNKVGSIKLNAPTSVFSSPVNFTVASGVATGSLSLNTQVANTVFAGPSSGADAAPAFRILVPADIPSLGANYIQNQTTQQASSNFNISGNGTVGTNLSVTGTSTLTGAVTSNGGITNTGIFTSSGDAVNINNNSNNITNINTGTSTGTVTIGNSSNNILLPKFNTAGGIIYTAASTGQIAGTGSNMTWDDVNSRLGIGITSPSSALHVNGMVSLGKSTATTGALNFYNSTNSNAVSINSGVTSSGYTLTLPTAAPTSNGQSLVSTTGGVLSWANSGTNSAWQLTGNSGTSATTNFIGTTDAIDFVTKTNNTERMRILGATNGTSQAGWIGMGITIPRSSLDVTGNYTNKNVLTIQNTSSSGYSSVDMMDNTGALAGTFGYGNSGTGTFFGSRDYFSTYNHDFVLNTNSGNYNFFVSGTSGKIGINTGTPSATLDVNGNFKLGASGTVLTNIYKTSVSITIPASFSSFSNSQTVAVANAPLNSTVIINPRSALPSGVSISYSYVSSANNVTVNFTGISAVVLAATVTFDVTVMY